MWKAIGLLSLLTQSSANMLSSLRRKTCHKLFQAVNCLQKRFHHLIKCTFRQLLWYCIPLCDWHLGLVWKLGSPQSVICLSYQHDCLGLGTLYRAVLPTLPPPLLHLKSLLTLHLPTPPCTFLNVSLLHQCHSLGWLEKWILSGLRWLISLLMSRLRVGYSTSSQECMKCIIFFKIAKWFICIFCAFCGIIVSL